MTHCPSHAPAIRTDVIAGEHELSERILHWRVWKLHRCILGLLALAVWPVLAQVPDSLLQTVHAPSMRAQPEARLGRSVAQDGAYTVVGVPYHKTSVNNSGQAKVFDSVTGALLFNLPNPDPEEMEYFGWSVAISGTRVVVGAHGDNTGANDAGSAYIYDLGSSTPTVPVLTLHNPKPVDDDYFGDHFGGAVAISGTWLVVGAAGAGTGGLAYAYNLSGTAPTVPVSTLNNPNPAFGDDFGSSVAISGTKVVIGAPDQNGGAVESGRVYVFDLSIGGTLPPVMTLNNPTPVAEGWFGSAVAISGMRVVVGAYRASCAYVYSLSGSTPANPVLTLSIWAAPNPYFGSAVSISGTRVLVGAVWEDTGAQNAGSAYLYDVGSLTPTVPTAIFRNPSPGAGDIFGGSVAVSGSRLVIAAFDDDMAATDAGTAYVYDVNSETPVVPTAVLSDPGVAGYDNFGMAVAMSGGLMAAGAPRDPVSETRMGRVHVYDLHGATPKVPVLSLDNPIQGAYFGAVLAMSGTRVVVGIPQNSNDSGRVCVYDLRSGTPTVPIVTLNNPSPAVLDYFGCSVAISGTLIVVGASQDDTGAANAGSAYVYDLSSDTPAVPLATLNNPEPVAGDSFGNSVAISGTRVVVGAYKDLAGTGSVYVYDLTSVTPTLPAATLRNVTDGAQGGNFGTSVGIAGSTVVIGVPKSHTMGFLFSGSVQVYDLSRSTSAPSFLPVLSSPHPSENGSFGGSLAISGSRVVVGAVGDNTSVLRPGRAYVYDLDSGTPRQPVASLDSPTPGTDDQFSRSLAINGAFVAVGEPFDDTVVVDKGSVYIFGPDPEFMTKQATQTLLFTAPTKLHLAQSPFTLSAGATSGLPVTFTVVSGPASVEGKVLTLNGTGVVKVRANQTGNASFQPAAVVERSITLAANPTMMTLVNLTQPYTGTPRPITVLGVTGPVEVTYNNGLAMVTTPPTYAGSYGVKAVAGNVTKTGTLNITKAPLFVTPFDQRKLVGQPNPVLGLRYTGFVAANNAVNSVGTMPALSTPATITSPGGLYPITARGGETFNYFFVYQKGMMKVETFAASYEAMLVDSGARPAAKLELTVAATGKTFSVKLATPEETAPVSLSGTLTVPSATETTTGTATVRKGSNTYLVTVTLPLTGDFNAEAKRNGVSLGTATEGRKLLTVGNGQTLSYVGAHSALLAPATAGNGVPAGAGWAVGTMDAKGVLKLTGKLADGTSFTTSLAADIGSNHGYRMFIQPYTPARTGSYLAGAFSLKSHPDLPGRRYVDFSDAVDFTWMKAARQADASYRDGFGPRTTRFTLDPWLPPVAAKGSVPAVTLAQRLGLSSPSNPFTVRHSEINSPSFAALPVSLALNATTNAVTVVAPANDTKWKVTLTPATGAFTGSFELNDAGKKRTVPFTGILRQPPSTDTSGLIGDGHFLLPSLLKAPNNETLSGEVGFERTFP